MSKKKGYTTANEFKPDLDDKYWDKINEEKNIYKYNNNIPDVVYTVTQKLIDKYPNLFSNKQFWGFECGDGWFAIIININISTRKNGKWRVLGPALCWARAG